MRERAKLLGAELAHRSVPGAGTIVEVRLMNPLTPRENDPA
jgi:signal transduction histidine kinase